VVAAGELSGAGVPADAAVHRRRPGADACPGALQLYPSQDGSLARVRLPGGVLTAAQLLVLAEAAGVLGDGHLELTSRGNVQIRRVAEGTEMRLATRLATAGLLPSMTHERVRNIIASPTSGRDGRGVTDLTGLVAELDGAICAAPELAELSGRFLFVLDDGRGDVAGLDGDLTAVAVPGGSAALLLGGLDIGVRAPLSTLPDVLVVLASAFLAVRAEQGSSAWRLAELAQRHAQVRALCEARLDELARLGCWPGPDRLGPLRRPARAELIGALPQSDGLVTLGTAARLGRLTATQAQLLAELAQEHGDEEHPGELRVTPWRGVLVLDRPARDAHATLNRCDAAGLIARRTDPDVGVTTCAGRPGCANALADVRTDAGRQLGVGGPAAPGDLPVHWVGCARRCGSPRGRAVEVLATGDGYRVTVAGRTLAEHTDPTRLASAIRAARRGLPTPATAPGAPPEPIPAPVALPMDPARR
jgi:precorrin-3B synthase